MFSRTLRRKLAQDPVLKDLIDLLPPGGEIYLVGGALRDLFLGRRSDDFDFATPFDPTSLAQAFARRIGGHWFFLDEPRRQSRVAIGGEEGLTCDFAPFRAPDLEGDLRLRDFTVNALAAALHREPQILDPLGGLSDLSDRLLRACSSGVFEDDPLRVLKGVRHSVALSFDIDEETAALMRAAAPRLASVAPERIRSELGSVLNAEPVTSALSLMQSLRVTDVLFGSASDERDCSAGEALAVRCEDLLIALNAESEEATLLSEEIEANFSRAALLKLGAFARGYARVEMPLLAEKFKMSRRSGAILNLLHGLESERWKEIEHIPPGRPRALWAADLGRHPVEALIFLSVLGGDESPVSILRETLRDYLSHSENGRIPDLLDGKRAGEILSLPPGPALGSALVSLRTEEIAGRIRTPDEAIRYLMQLAEKKI